MEKPWKDDFDELDVHVSKLIMNFSGSVLPAYAIAAALIDEGIISRAKLLEVITAVHDFATAHAVVGEVEDELEALDLFAMYLEEIPIEAGNALDLLRGYASSRALLDMIARRKRPE